MAKIEHQIIFITRLREFTGLVPAAYASQKEFFVNSLRSMSEHLLDLKKETLEEACRAFSDKLDKGAATAQAISELEDVLEKLVPGKDFTLICGSMIGNKELIKKRLAALIPISLVGEENKAVGRDPAADRRITETYSRLKFDSLVGELNTEPDERAIDAVLIKARAEVAEYCCLYHIPLTADDTLTPFSLINVDAVLAAGYRLLSNIRKRTHLKDPWAKLILIVDDDESILELLEFLVLKEGFRVEKAADGKDVVKKTRALKPDLILLDLMLPNCNGFEILRELQEEETSDIPIVVITGRHPDRSMVETIKQEPNVKDYMEKPVKHQAFAATLHKLLKAQAK